MSAVVCVAVVTGLLLVAAPPAFAARTYVGQLPRPGGLAAVAIDSANHVWVSHGGTIYEYEAYPSTAIIGEQTGGGKFCGAIKSLAVDSANGDLYAANSECGAIDVFDPAGEFVEQWKVGETLTGHITTVAVDNSGGPSNGRVYVSEGDALEAFEPDGEPADFSSNASYVSGNAIAVNPAASRQGVLAPKMSRSAPTATSMS